MTRATGREIRVEHKDRQDDERRGQLLSSVQDRRYEDVPLDNVQDYIAQKDP